jgi:hypothetical protein
LKTMGVLGLPALSLSSLDMWEKRKLRQLLFLSSLSGLLLISYTMTGILVGKFILKGFGVDLVLLLLIYNYISSHVTMRKIITVLVLQVLNILQWKYLNKIQCQGPTQAIFCGWMSLEWSWKRVHAFNSPFNIK